MSTPEAIQAKADGAAAWSAGNFSQAAEHFTTAINLGGDKEFLKVLHSNRSAAYLKLNRITEALKDGNKCVELDNNWVKGYARKGDALLASKQFTEAYNAYNAGSRIAPNDASMQEKMEQAMRAIRNASDQTSRASAGSSSPFAGVNVPPTPSADKYVQIAQTAVLVLAVLYMIPFLPSSYRTLSHKLCIGTFAAVSLYNLYLKYGFPKFTTEFAQKLVPDPLSMDLFLSVVLLMNKPYLTSMSPVLIKAFATFTPRILTYVREQLPAIQGQLEPLLAKYMPSMRGANLAQLANPSAAPEINKQLLRMAATMEAYHGIYLIFELIMPSRNLMQLYIYWQYLRLRYMVDSTGDLKLAFVGVDQRIQTVLAFRMVPDAVRKGYAMLQTYLAKQVEAPTGEAPAAGGGGGLGGMMSGLASKCSVM
eukprot:CAMPEP_0184974678 /NCGR_PEP_ID=MMETSP1098-20130426/6099_1 /TAXON_ID=89044 /ORGANISM="Spumella elongata, Strain CCAP 955/1" /LENGTH=421 /DNA_ID=CAMNT_0027497293 /DNA_START=20 /DNA_END=1285 /DNA_ORIENTATION=-